jgi:hypothetical protein
VSNGYEFGETVVEDYDEAVESDDIGEAFPFGRRRQTARPSAHRYSAPSTQAQGQYVKRSELQQALKPISDDMRKNATAIAGVSSQVAGISRNFQSVQGNIQMLTLLPLLAGPKPIVTTAATAGIPQGTKLQVAGDGLTALLPLLLLSGGLGGSAASGSGQASGGMQDPMMMIVLLMALSDRK